MLLGLTEPTSGQVRILGFDPGREPLKVKARVGYLPDQVGFYDELTAEENLRYIARLNRLPAGEAEQRIQAALARVDLSKETLRRSVRTYSHGMRQRLGLAELLVKRAEIVILDEPTLGLDPEAAHEFLNLIHGFKAEGITIILSSHLLHQVQAVCDRVGLFHRGKMVLEGAVPALAQQVLGGAYRIHLELAGPELSEHFEKLEGVLRVRREGSTGYVLEADRDLRGAASQLVVNQGGKLLALRSEEPDLDEVYTHYFKEIAHATSA
jgi:ABC-2 type transport system ATP-binding protein